MEQLVRVKGQTESMEELNCLLSKTGLKLTRSMIKALHGLQLLLTNIMPENLGAYSSTIMYANDTAYSIDSTIALISKLAVNFLTALPTWPTNVVMKIILRHLHTAKYKLCNKNKLPESIKHDYVFSYNNYFTLFSSASHGAQDNLIGNR